MPRIYVVNDTVGAVLVPGGPQPPAAFQDRIEETDQEDVQAGATRNAEGGWTNPPNPPSAGLLSQVQWLDLFTFAEIAGFNFQRRRIKNLTEADYGSNDPAKQALVQFEVFLTYYDKLGDQIDRLDPKTAQGIALLVALGVLTEERAEAILAGEAHA